MDSAKLNLHRVTMRFTTRRGQQIVAVEEVSFAVAAGEVYGLLGPNGAGKTTTIRMLLGLLRPTSGQSSIAGFGSTTYPEEVKRRVGLVSASESVGGIRGTMATT